MKRRSFLATSLTGAGGLLMKSYGNNSLIASYSYARAAVADPELPARIVYYYEKYTSADAIQKYFSPQPKTRTQLVTTLPPRLAELDLKDDPYFAKGLLNLKYYAKGDGVTDDTEAIMEALYDSYFFHLAAYFPPGTYLVSDSLACCVYMDPKGHYRDGNGFLIMSDPDQRAVIKLIDNAPLFQNPQQPRTILELWVSKSGATDETGLWLDSHDAPWYMNNGGVSSIIIDCGNGNPGAIGIGFNSAQASYLENILVRAHGALAGIKDIPSSAGYAANLEVQGGKYGIWIHYTNPGSGIAGCTLIDQDEYALVQDSGCNPIFLAGFRIEKQRGPVTLQGRNTWNKIPNANAGGQLSLVDGVVILNERSTAFENLMVKDGRLGKDLYIRNVYVQNAETLIHCVGQNPIPAPETWSHIREYAFNSTASLLIIDGKNGPNEFINIESGGPESDLTLTRHWLKRRELPMALDKNAVNICDPIIMGEMAAKGDGIADDTPAFRYAVKNFKTVYVPKGTFRITGNVELQQETVLTGLSSHLTWIVPNIGKWKDTNHTPVFSTVDDSEASCVISQMTVIPAITDPSWADGVFIAANRTGRLGSEYTSKKWDNGWPLLDWKAGRKSVVKNVYPQTFWDRKMPDGPIMRISGNGGGRWFAFDAMGNGVELSLININFRHSLVEGTNEPLAFYQHAAIHGVMDYCNIIRNSKNIEIFGLFPEEKVAIYLLIDNCENILVTSLGNNSQSDGMGKPLIEVKNSKDLTISIIGAKNGPTWSRLKDDLGILVPGTNNVSYYRISAEGSLRVYKTKEDKIRIYPTLTNGEIHIAGSNEIEKIELISLKGMVVKSWNQASQISIVNVLTGYYVLRIKEIDGNITIKRIVKY